MIWLKIFQIQLCISLFFRHGRLINSKLLCLCIQAIGHTRNRELDGILVSYLCKLLLPASNLPCSRNIYLIQLAIIFPSHYDEKCSRFNCKLTTLPFILLMHKLLFCKINLMLFHEPLVMHNGSALIKGFHLIQFSRVKVKKFSPLLFQINQELT